MSINRHETRYIKDLYSIELPELSPDEIRSLGHRPGGAGSAGSGLPITPTGINELWRLTEDGQITRENGICRLPSGGWLVSVRTEMPFVRPEMIPWWFWWYPQDPERFKVWFPGEHFDISVKEDYLYDGPFLDFFPSTQYPVETFGGKKLHLVMQFVEPEEFGFSKNSYPEKGIDRIITANIGIKLGGIQHSKTAHIFRRTRDGMEVICRYWMGERILPAFQRKYFTEENIHAVAVHCRREYMRLGQILPGLYKEFR
jgi:hypothetical protein